MVKEPPGASTLDRAVAPPPDFRHRRKDSGKAHELSPVHSTLISSESRVLTRKRLDPDDLITLVAKVEKNLTSLTQRNAGG
jgi:hypothetical protein